jgi:hypothetical protein
MSLSESAARRGPALAAMAALTWLAALIAPAPMAAQPALAPSTALAPMAAITAVAAADPPAAPPAATDTAAPAPGKGPKGAAAAKPAAAPAKPAPPPPKPPVPNAALGQLKSLVGDWTCTGRTFGPGPEHATAGTLGFAWQLDGFWLEGRYEEPKGDAKNPVPVSWRMFLGYEELQQQLTVSTFDNITGAATLYAAAGWQGDKLVYEGMAHRGTLQFQTRESFVRKGDDQLVHTQEANVAENWIKLHEDTCKRATAK